MYLLFFLLIFGGVIIARLGPAGFSFDWFSAAADSLSCQFEPCLIFIILFVTGFGKKFAIPGPGVSYVRVGLNLLLKLMEFVAQVFTKYYVRSFPDFPAFMTSRF